MARCLTVYYTSLIHAPLLGILRTVFANVKDALAAQSTAMIESVEQVKEVPVAVARSSETDLRATPTAASTWLCVSNSSEPYLNDGEDTALC